MDADRRKQERELYPTVKAWLEELLEERFQKVYLEITASRTFRDTIKGQIDRNRDLIFSFLGETAPDLTGFLKKDTSASREFIVVEVKSTDRKSTRLNSSHVRISYAVFCLKNK